MRRLKFAHLAVAGWWICKKAGELGLMARETLWMGTEAWCLWLFRTVADARLNCTVCGLGCNRLPLHNPSPEKIPGKIDADREFVNNSINQPQIQLI
jgi:hypothetical protein